MVAPSTVWQQRGKAVRRRFEAECPPRGRRGGKHVATRTLTITRAGDDYIWSCRQRGIPPLGFVKNAQTWPALRRRR